MSETSEVPRATRPEQMRAQDQDAVSKKDIEEKLHEQGTLADGETSKPGEECHRWSSTKGCLSESQSGNPNQIHIYFNASFEDNICTFCCC